MSGQPFAVFDIDGTLIRWQLYHALADELARAGFVDRARYQKVLDARTNWKNRTEQTAFQAYEKKLVKLIENTIKGISLENFNTACQRVIRIYRDQVYTYTRDLIRQLQAKNYLLFAISGSQIEIVGLLAEYYGFDDFGGSRYTIKDGHFTGEGYALKREKKPELLRQLVSKHGADWQHSLGIGDSESDIPMLETVEQPIAFNPTRQLFDHAQAQHWKIVLERKNVVYELEPTPHGYTLTNDR